LTIGFRYGAFMIAKVVNASTGIFNLQEPGEPGVRSYVESSPIVGADVDRAGADLPGSISPRTGATAPVSPG